MVPPTSHAGPMVSQDWQAAPKVDIYPISSAKSVFIEVIYFLLNFFFYWREEKGESFVISSRGENKNRKKKKISVQKKGRREFFSFNVNVLGRNRDILRNVWVHGDPMALGYRHISFSVWEVHLHFKSCRIATRPPSW